MIETFAFAMDIPFKASADDVAGNEGLRHQPDEAYYCTNRASLTHHDPRRIPPDW
jgi:hypothetical protein